MLHRKLGVVFVLGCLLVSSLFVSAASRIENEMGSKFEIVFVISEPCSLVRFVDTISDRDHTTTWLRDWYFEQVGDKASEEKASLAKFKLSMEQMDQRYKFRDSTGNKKNTSQYLASLAAKCSSLEEFLKSLQNVFSDADYSVLADTYMRLDPIYQKLVWRPRLSQLQKQLDEFGRESQNTNLANLLVKVQAFMQSPWASSTPFTVVLVPLPETDKKNTHGESIGNVQIVELLSSHQFKDQADVVFHEACHALWHSKKNLDKVQKEFDKDGALLAYSELNEGLATALGQGWFNQEAFGAAPDKSWYMDDIINSYAHGLLPLVSEYLKNNKTLDSEFARRAAAIFKERFPKTSNATKLTSSLMVFVDDASANSAELKRQLLSRLPRMHSLGISTPINYASLLKGKMKTDKTLVLMSPNKLSKLQKAGLTAKEIELLSKNQSSAVALKVKDRDLIFVLGNDFLQQEKLLLSILDNGEWPVAPLPAT